MVIVHSYLVVKYPFYDEANIGWDSYKMRRARGSTPRALLCDIMQQIICHRHKTWDFKNETAWMQSHTYILLVNTTVASKKLKL